MANNIPLSKETLKLLSDLSLAAGFLSIIVSMISWFFKRGENRAQAERFAIFVGLWVPSLFALSHRLSRAADEGYWGAMLHQRGIRKVASDFLEEVGGVPQRS